MTCYHPVPHSICYYPDPSPGVFRFLPGIAGELVHGALMLALWVTVIAAVFLAAVTVAVWLSGRHSPFAAVRGWHRYRPGRWQRLLVPYHKGRS